MDGLPIRKKEPNAPYLARNFLAGEKARIRIVGMIAVVHIELVVPVRIRNVAAGEAPVILSAFVHISESIFQNSLRFLCGKASVV